MDAVERSITLENFKEKTYYFLGWPGLRSVLSCRLTRWMTPEELHECVKREYY